MQTNLQRGGQWPLTISHDSFLLFVTALPCPVSLDIVGAAFRRPRAGIARPYTHFPTSSVILSEAKDPFSKAPLPKGGC